MRSVDSKNRHESPLRSRGVTAFDRLILGRTLGAPDPVVRRAILLAWFSVVLGGTSLLLAVYCLLLPSFVGAAIGLVSAIGYAVGMMLVRSGRPGIAAHLLCLYLLLGLFASAALVAGPTALMSPWLALLPLVATYVIGRQAGLAYGTASLLSAVLLAVLDHFYLLPIAPMSLRDYARADLLPAAIGVVVVVAIGLLYERALDRELDRRLGLEADLRNAQRLEAIGRLVAVMAHEVNNPLAFVGGNIGYVLEELGQPSPDSAEIRQALEEAVGGVERIQRIVADLKTVSRDEPGEQADWVPLVDVLNFALRLAQNQIRHVANLERDFDAPIEVLAPRTRLGQVFLNLIINAAQAIEPGRTDRNRISVRSQLTTDGCWIEVEDTGVGIPAENLERIFEPFFTTKPIGTGTGLGLSVCQGIVEQLGGKLEVTSVPNSGTTARVFLPKARLPVEPLPTPSPPVRPPGLTGNVLVVDDEPAVGKVLQRMLAPLAVQVETNAERALEVCGGQRFDVVLCDLMMPNLSGRDFLERLKALWPDAESRVVFITGGSLTQDLESFLNAHPHLLKPFEPAQLRSLVQARLTAISDAADDDRQSIANDSVTSQSTG